MARAYQKYEKVFGAKGIEHPDIDFRTNKGSEIRLVWEKVEYRAYKLDGGGLVDMRLGSTLPNNLQRYIVNNF